MPNNVYSFRFLSGSDDRCSDEFPLQSSITAEHSFDDAVTWDAVLTQFLNFLSGIYGYDITSKVSFESLNDKLDRLRENGVLQDDEEAWDDEYTDEERCPLCGN